MSVFSIIWQIVFWTSSCLFFYTYIGYPLFVRLLSRVRPKDVNRGNLEPKVTILITAYNEERDIKAKLENTLQLDYPKDKLEILVASDGSTDNTDNIVRQFSAQNIRLFRQEGRVGKTITQNNAVEQSKGEIIIFSDATTDYHPNVLREMLPNFADETIGCVAGKLIYVDKTKSAVGKGAKGYWNYETFLKESESRACSLIGASGCLYAVRKSAYVPMYAEACSDFLIATLIYEQGLRTIYEPNAICEEETNRRTDKEFSMRVRVIGQTFTDLWRNKRMLNPFYSGFYAIQLISHKVFRYAVPLFLFLMFISSAFLSPNSWFFAGILLLQVLFYAFAFVAWVAEKAGKKLGVLSIPLYFVLANWASAVAFYRFLSGETYARWEPIRENSHSL